VREEHALPVDRLLHGWKRGRDVGDRLWSLVLGCGELVMGLAAVLLLIEKGKEAVVCLDGCRGNVTQPRRVFVGYGAAMPWHVFRPDQAWYIQRILAVFVCSRNAV
jgi:hypothetical protein